jgi:GNAT superfamily N-acetyltransferase
MRSRAQRFLHQKSRLTPSELRYLTQCDGVNHLGLALIVTDEEAREIAPVAVARCVRTRRFWRTADVAVTVLDAWQGKGVGKILLRDLARRARKVGIQRFRGTLWADNAPARALLDDVGTKVRERAEGPGVVEVVYRIETSRKEAAQERTDVVPERTGIGPRSAPTAAAHPSGERLTMTRR